MATKTVDYYEFLQISPHADQDTIHRVYRFLGARFHPDNPVSGDAETFSVLKTAYEVLSDPARRAEYDCACERESNRRAPLSKSIDFMDSMDGEENRRLALLAVLYFQRRANPGHPHVSLAEIETRMGFPRDYLDFTTWYLQQKRYITIADNSDFTLTVHGVDFVETQRVNIPVLNKLLTSGTDPSPAHEDAEMKAINAPPEPLVASPNGAPRVERRVTAKDRRTNAPDRRANPVERRANVSDRRMSMSDRRNQSTERRSKS